MPQNHTINSSYYCESGRREGVVSVLNTGAYLLAEYSEHTGELKWQRVIPAEQKKSIENWLLQHFPPADAKSRSVSA